TLNGLACLVARRAWRVYSVRLLQRPNIAREACLILNPLETYRPQAARSLASIRLLASSAYGLSTASSQNERASCRSLASDRPIWGDPNGLCLRWIDRLTHLCFICKSSALCFAA